MQLSKKAKTIVKNTHKRPVFYSVILFLLYIIPVVIFVELAEDVREGEKFFFDSVIMNWLHGMHSPVLTTLFSIVTDFGGVVGVPVVVAIFTLLLWKLYKRKRAALFMLLSVGGAAGINLVLKSFFQRSRPDFWDHLVKETSYSFPSGHAMASTALAVSVMVLCWNTRWRWLAIILGGLYMIIVGVSRMYLGVHYPSDILAGWCVSAVWVLCVAAVMYEYSIHHKTAK